MIILYDKTETSFKSLGLGVLNDTISCIVVEQLNGSFELEMEYPLSGQHYKSIELENFIFVKPNMYDNEQAFRIYSISKPFNGIVTINAEHISYDMNGYTIPPFTANNLQEAIDIISDTSVVPNNFKFYTDKEVNSKMISPTPSSMRGLIAGREGSLLDIYKGEFIFDMYDVRLVNKRGEDRGVSIKYGKNMLDIEQDITSEKLFTGIFPFYHTTKNETVVERIMIYEEVYIVQGTNPRYSDWLSKYPSDDFLNGGDPLLPMADNTPVQIKTPGDYLDTIFWYEKATLTKGTLVLANTRDNPEYSINWLSNFETGVNIQPQEYIIYNIRTEGDFEGMKVVWNQTLNKYEEYSGEGFYYIPNTIPPPNFPKEISSNDNQIEVYKDLRSITDNPNIVDGVLYVEGKKDSPHQKILTLDITDKFAEEPTLEHLLAKAEDYMANNNLDEIKEEIKVSFIKLSDSVEYEHYKDLEKVKLGDIIHISYERLNIETTKTVIETEYNVLTNTYNEIELGTKKSSLGDTVMIAGSNVSELTNDANYTDKIVVGRLLAQYITADLIESKVANFVNAAIESLTVRKMEVTGLIEASAAAINSLVAQSLTAENAEIKEALEAGQVTVKGKITALSGVIGGAVIEDGLLQVPMAQIIDLEITYATVTELQAANARIDTIEADYIVTSQLQAAEARIDTIEADYIVTSQLEAAEARIDTIEADYIVTSQLQAAEARIDTIEADYIVTSQLQAANARIDTIEADYITTDQLTAAEARIDTIEADYITTDQLTAYEINADKIVGGTISSSTIDIGSGNFTVDSDGNVNITKGEIKLGIQTWFEHSHSNPVERYFYVDSVVIDGLTLYRWASYEELHNTTSPQYLLTDIKDVGIGDVVWGWQQIDEEQYGDFSEYENEPHIQRTINNVSGGQDYNFVVDEEGNLTGKGKIDFVMFSVEDGIVRAEQFIMGTSGDDASVTIDEEGKLTATNAKIIGDIETDHIKSKKVTIQDSINIDLVTDAGTMYNQTVTNTVTAVIEQPNESILYVYVKVNKDLWYDQTLSVKFTYTRPYLGGSTTRTETKSFTLKANTSSYPTSGYGDKYDPGSKTYKFSTSIYQLPHDGGNFTNYYINSRTPTSWSETEGVPDHVSAQIDTHFSPKTNILDLGKSNRRWRAAYVLQPYFTNQPSISSDRRLKKDIEYDISRYDKLFDGLKPTAYKLVDGESGRTHLGLIAQDLQELLESCDIDSKDFAGFIKQFKDPDILLKKKLEDLTEDDYEYGIRYSEIQALQIRQIQLLKKQVKELAEKVAALENNGGS